MNPVLEASPHFLAIGAPGVVVAKARSHLELRQRNGFNGEASTKTNLRALFSRRQNFYRSQAAFTNNGPPDRVPGFLAMKRESWARAMAILPTANSFRAEAVGVSVDL